MSEHVDTLRTVANQDQVTTELNDTIGRVCIAYTMMRNTGVPEPDAAAIATAYSQRVLNRHFGVTMFAMGDAYMDDDDDA